MNVFEDFLEWLCGLESSLFKKKSGLIMRVKSLLIRVDWVVSIRYIRTGGKNYDS